MFDTVTVVGLYDGQRYEAFVAGQNLEELPARLKNFSVVVTFNGSNFDLKFLKLAFPSLQLPPIHIDLRWLTRRLGFSGGLKSIERELGFARDESTAEVDGFEATVLWARHLRGEQEALGTLLAYNREDVVNLKGIMEVAYDRLALETSANYFKTQALFEGLEVLPESPTLSTRKSIDRVPVALDLLARIDGRPPRIVGIDLTGSERRATGWALMEGAIASTLSIHADEELFQKTIAARPDIVSIDSPLSVPEGWDEDQNQLQSDAPIYRKCELALKRMGISVFWCLLPTMKGLTRRGMLLAGRLRDHGIPVIESYPGAAQDLLGIPRKGSSLAELKWGLNRAGISGSFIEGRVTHDEVDAITSALVGLFYVANDYIALGTPTEDYLIVPRAPSINYAKLKQILALSGLDDIEPQATEKRPPLDHAQPFAIA